MMMLLLAASGEGSGLSPEVGLGLVVLLVLANGFFVAAEFALVAAKRHRVEKAAAEGQRGAGAALAGMRELSLMLAGAQLGITVCTLGLGSLSKPAISHELDPLLHKLGLPSALSCPVPASRLVKCGSGFQRPVNQA